MTTPSHSPPKRATTAEPCYCKRRALVVVVVVVVVNMMVTQIINTHKTRDSQIYHGHSKSTLRRANSSIIVSVSREKLFRWGDTLDAIGRMKGVANLSAVVHVAGILLEEKNI